MDQDEFKKIISQAISQEVEAFTFYSTVSDKAKDVNLKRLFKGLAEEEAKHKRTLEGFLTKDPGKMHFSVSPDYKVVDALPTPRLPTLNRLMAWNVATRANWRISIRTWPFRNPGSGPAFSCGKVGGVPAILIN